MNGKRVPYIFDPIYKSEIKNHLVLYNPFSYKGLFVLHKKFSKLIESIDGKKTIGEYFTAFREFDSNITDSTITTLFEKLENHDVLNYKNSKNYFHPNPNQEKLYDKALRFWIILTNQCNFRCTYCWVDKKTKKMSKELIDVMIEKIYSLAKKHNIPSIGFDIAGGEPLMEPEILKSLINKIHEVIKREEYKHMVTTIAIVTNVSLLTEELAKFLNEKKVPLGVSIDGIGKIHDYTRKFANGSGTYKYVKRGIEIARKYKILSNIICTITSKNIHHVPKLAEFYQKLNINFTLHFYRKVSKVCQEELIKYNEESVSSYKKTLKKIYDGYNKKKLDFSPFYQAPNKLLDTVILFNNVSKYPCTAGLSFFSINPDGNISDCPTEDDKAVASIYDDDFIQTVRKRRLKVIEKLTSGTKGKCDDCLWKYNCRSMCPLERKFDKSIDKCLMMKKLIPYVIQLETNRIINMNIKQIARKSQ